ncbi:hypothetical protein XENTR_v10011822 [Xenopus tropicalis]|uniref:ZZ-type zinc finger-containing protein 3 n=1 Tax=Xenopus tropicalis TaxID=8364 RepID=A0A6I8PZN4_XENTR|nr:ZZ-type zinc finger-containing protein 3 [Xenopus tropicalis]XP_002939691.2 ZZ-type zinc finger-containing protein 3 [Xenopus tropicalis]XP_004913976.1 ZZ-type zinc finger-containing protein 3 [Xenopus tropicalis]KAE8609497.1 hypothetical protein XENTR_v10011822 [Xenopus tropicalis]KAE8609498.1 hypothetical protein XENTR_v10011822 [Xenopus tropicalis]KAE8609499.1 hypothetical protein XENTR_v10011822 [Xenopus tropicalis]|eukprot:XP_002939690.2 PREDICTED: ZZ-type zinc finger-containing protein 3 [Xenopus tropicalis]
MAASRSTRVTRSTVGFNGLDENFCGRTLRNRSIAHAEEVVPQSLLRSRSPKKKSETAQKGICPRSGELKPTGPRESWVSPRKRGLSVSEKDIAEKDSVENSEIRSPGALSPVLKKIKHCLRSDEPSSPEEKVSTTERKNSCSDNETDSTSTKRAHRCILLDDRDKGEIKKEFEPEEHLKKTITIETASHKTLNGVDEKNTAAFNCNDCQSDGSTKQNTVALPPHKEKIVSENGSSLNSYSVLTNRKDTLLDHNVPCTNSEERAEKKNHSLVASCLPIDNVNQTNKQTSFSSETLSSARDSDEISGAEDSASEVNTENTVSVINAAHDNCVSGDPESELSFAELDVDNNAATFSDTQEHRYTLRTSPRRPLSIKDSPCKNEFPCGENGPIDESKICTSNNSKTTSTVNGSLIITDVAHIDKKQDCGFVRCSADKQTVPNSETVPASQHIPTSKERGGQQTTEDEEEDPDVYYFESDHVALKHNTDYQRLLQTISVLEAQRTQAVQDMERLGQYQRQALANPIGFVEKLQKKMDIGIPCPQRIVQLPEVSWEQYTTGLGNFERELRKRKHNSRRVKLSFDKVGISANAQKNTENSKDRETASYSVLPQSDNQQGSTSGHSQIGGRLCTETKPGTFNQLWSVEEQKKLERLLLKYPPEEVEAKRWQKIADELGNRTAKQVASRVQKYFIKLTKAGLPVPGRTPNLYMYAKKSSGKRQHALNKYLFRPSTFMTSHEPPVYMDEEDDRLSFNSRDLDPPGDEEISDDEDIHVDCHGLAEYKELIELKKLKKQKLHQMRAQSGFVQHVGFKCDNCETEPIQGIRWHCQDCPPQMSVDFCDSCSDCLYETETHKEDHHLEPIYKAETFLDRDYCMPHNTNYNYLDPNYFPANR